MGNKVCGWAHRVTGNAISFPRPAVASTEVRDATQALHRLPRFSVAGTCVIDGLLGHSSAEHVRRPSVPTESPTLGFTHLQFEALLTAARESSHPCDFALVAMLGLLGLRIFDIADLGEEHGHRVLRVCGKGAKVVLVPLPPAVGRAIEVRPRAMVTQKPPRWPCGLSCSPPRPRSR